MDMLYRRRSPEFHALQLPCITLLVLQFRDRWGGVGRRCLAVQGEGGRCLSCACWYRAHRDSDTRARGFVQYCQTLEDFRVALHST